MNTGVPSSSKQVWLSGALKPLAQATSEAIQMEFPEEEEHSCGAFTCSIA